jgi:SEC-C motif-containing protein
LHLQAPTAEALMRSRYSAFVRGDLPYLLATWHPDTRPATLDPDPPGLRWLGLEVRRHADQDADHATVEFVARSKLQGRAHRLHETSRFVRLDGRWHYLDGDVG